MKTQAMSSALRATLTLREARALHDLAMSGAKALGYMAPSQTDSVIAALAAGIAELDRKQADARARRNVVAKRPSYPPMMNLTVGGFTISAHKGDWIDISTVPDLRFWSALTDENETMQSEIRREAWRVLVLNPSPYGSMFLASDCTLSASKSEVEQVAQRLVAGLDPALVPEKEGQ
ncbi:hypothetical protein [Sphingobium baderi]|uniref:Uncharacterized protein n=1 Tax=Sphingobium baderi TaxID=1332080 RepID=A0A0S3F676_9SPHN|nr:hypothetical protein [Sphingobium baderi]ALR23153.1 hypothetical protein ATN00_21885 [Sphingobium baderi]